MAKKKTTRSKNKNRDITGNIIGIVLVLIVIIGYREYGPVGRFLSNAIRVSIGNDYHVGDVLLLLMGLFLALFGSFSIMKPKYGIGLLILLLSFCLYMGIPDKPLVGFDVLNDYLDHFKQIWNNTYSNHGGFLGALLYSVTSMLVAKGGSYLIVGALVLIAIVVIVELDNVKEFFKKIYYALTEPADKAPAKKKTVVKDNYLVEEPVGKKKKFSFISMDFDADEEEEEEIVEVKDRKKSNRKTQKPSYEEEEEETEVKPAPVRKESDMPAVSIETNTDSAAVAKEPLKNYTLPKQDKLLDKSVNKKSSTANRNAAEDKGQRLIEILEDFDIPCRLVNTTVGPSVTKFEIKPESTVKISRINQVQDNLKMELAAKSLRIEAPVPGKSVVGIEIPNVEMTMVRMHEIMSSFPSGSDSKKLLFGLGKDLSGSAVFCQLDKMPHLLVAGATGSGKSVCINGIITTFLLRTKPDEVKLLLIDPKKVEFTPYKEIPHLIGPVISDAHEASLALQVIVKYMDNRYTTFAKYGVRNIEGYNEYVEYHPDENLQKMYRIVVIIDELADLMTTNKKDVEQSIQRITQLARAAGIHLIVATQRPSTDVITGIIKANIPSRIAFAVSSGVDSRTILDQYGAEKLLGNGDMLYAPIGEQSPIRVQGVYVSDKEVEDIAKEVSRKAKPFFEDEFTMLRDVNHDQLGFDANGQSDDPMYEECKRFVAEQQKASTSLLQRKFGIGYNRAARIIDALEQNGVIGPAQGSKPRDVFVEIVEDEIVTKLPS